MAKYLGDALNPKVTHKFPSIAKAMDETKPSKSEVPIGGIMKDTGKSRQYYRVIKATRNGSCMDCDFLEGGICQKVGHSPCTAYSRSDKTWVIFKKHNGTTK